MQPHVQESLDFMQAVERHHPTLSLRPRASVFSVPLQMLPKFEIGTLVSREFVPYKADESGFYLEMCKRVGQASGG